jgi:hypothetical protein
MDPRRARSNGRIFPPGTWPITWYPPDARGDCAPSPAPLAAPSPIKGASRRSEIAGADGTSEGNPEWAPHYE